MTKYDPPRAEEHKWFEGGGEKPWETERAAKKK
jgi:hypothetical protein